jgi:hypothetical protein
LSLDHRGWKAAPTKEQNLKARQLPWMQHMARGAILPTDERFPLWEGLPATIKTQQPAFAGGYGGHEMPLPQHHRSQFGL